MFYDLITSPRSNAYRYPLSSSFVRFICPKNTANTYEQTTIIYCIWRFRFQPSDSIFCIIRLTGQLGLHGQLLRIVVESTMQIEDFLKKLVFMRSVGMGTLGCGNWFTPSFGRHLNPIPTGWGRLCLPYTNVPIKVWKPQSHLSMIMRHNL